MNMDIFVIVNRLFRTCVNESCSFLSVGHILSLNMVRCIIHSKLFWIESCLGCFFLCFELAHCGQMYTFVPETPGIEASL